MGSAHAAAVAVAVAWIGLGVSAAAADTEAGTASYKAPIVASLAPEEGSRTTSPHASSPRRPAANAEELLGSPAAQLATTAAVVVFAMFLASLASKPR